MRVRPGPGWWVAVLLAAGTARADLTGRKWSRLPVAFSVFNHPRVQGVAAFGPSALPAVLRGFARWTEDEVSCTGWQLAYGGLFDRPSPAQAVDLLDRTNRVVWQSGDEWENDDLTLGVTSVGYYPSTGEIFDADLALNGDYTWKVGGGGQSVDVESVVTHEAGHFLGLGHSREPKAVMYARYQLGELKSQLQAADIQDVCALYPRPPAPPPPADLCAFCLEPKGCSSGVCATSGPHRFCTAGCQRTSDCPVGFACSGKACLPDSGECPKPQCSTARDCAEGYGCRSGKCEKAAALGARCEASLLCGPCALCVGTSAEAYCRACCAPDAAAGCQGCPERRCPAQEGCLGGPLEAACQPLPPAEPAPTAPPLLPEVTPVTSGPKPSGCGCSGLASAAAFGAVLAFIRPGRRARRPEPSTLPAAFHSSAAARAPPAGRESLRSRR